MKKSWLTDKVRLLHIRQAITYLESFLTEKNKESLYEEPLLRFAVERQLEIIGEAANNLSDTIKVAFPEIEWKKVVAFRNFIVHEYFGVDLELIWDILATKIGPLKRTVHLMLNYVENQLS